MSPLKHKVCVRRWELHSLNWRKARERITTISFKSTKAQASLRSRRPTGRPRSYGIQISTARSLKRSKRKLRPSLKTSEKPTLSSLIRRRGRCMTMEPILKRSIKEVVVEEWAAWTPTMSFKCSSEAAAVAWVDVVGAVPSSTLEACEVLLWYSKIWASALIPGRNISTTSDHLI